MKDALTATSAPVATPRLHAARIRCCETRAVPVSVGARVCTESKTHDVSRASRYWVPRGCIGPRTGAVPESAFLIAMSEVPERLFSAAMTAMIALRVAMV